MFTQFLQGKKVHFFKRILWSTLILFVVFGCPLIGQPIFSPGQVVLASGDTLNGLVGEWGSYKRYQKCLFKASKREPSITYLPSDLRSYAITGRTFYESSQIKIEGKEIDVFVEYFVKGDLSLLKYKLDYFFKKGNEELVKVPAKSRRPELVKDQLSEGQLKLKWYQFNNELAIECPDLVFSSIDLEQSKYSPKALVELAKNYNECQGTPYITYGTDLPFATVDIGPAISLNRTDVNFFATSKLPFGFLEQTNITNTGFELSVPVIIRAVRNLSNLAVVFDPYYRRQQFYYEILEEDIFFPDQHYNDFSMSYTTAGLFAGFRYILPNMQPQISLQSGVRFDFLFSPDISIVREQILFQNDIIYSTRTPVEVFQLAKSQVGLTTQINLTNKWASFFDKWELAVGLHLGRGITRADETADDDFFAVNSNTNIIFLKTSFLW